jgi:hypothetical protein
MKKIFSFLLIVHCAFAIDNCMCQWVQVSNGIGINKRISSLINNGNNIFAGTNNYGIYLSSNNGDLWTPVNNGLSNQNITALISKGNYIFAGTNGSGVFYSTNNGNSWTAANNGISISSMNIFCFHNDGTKLYAGTTFGVYLSTNYGANWAQVGNDQGTIYSIETSGNFIFVANFPNGVYRTSNGGLNWIQQNAGLNNLLVQCLLINGNSLFLGTGYGGGIYRSSNFLDPYELHWLLTNNGITNNHITAFTSSGNDIFSSSLYGTKGVFLTTNNGDSWLIKNQGFGNNVSGVLSLLIANNYIFAGTDSHSVWKRNLSEIIGVKKNESSIPLECKIYQNYPNPFNPTTNIKYQIPILSSPHVLGGDLVLLKVYDILGKEVATLVNEKQSPGTYEVTFDGSQYPSGVYFYKLIAGDFSETKKMVIIK